MIFPKALKIPINETDDESIGILIDKEYPDNSQHQKSRIK
jgi:hypothetical protein